jgi:hypothetical protein
MQRKCVPRPNARGGLDTALSIIPDGRWVSHLALRDRRGALPEARQDQGDLLAGLLA